MEKGQKMLTVGVEIGGTYTDLNLMSEAEIIATLKVPTTPEQLEIGVIEAFKQLARNFVDIDMLIHGSTIATNAILERRGAITGPIT
jgi:N-methylhydantoinase A